MCDKDFIERGILEKEFPHSSLHICLFHVLRAFRREITTNKRGLTQAERTLALEIVQKMSYASSEDEYMQHYGL